ncbi:MAG: DUF4845 domain-containing protein [Mizugakiibacter sp.]|uniref:DUF4845 domain-containing protein n=1 Tax=Mizugakiibacter sp. TaxID=1972610 RepID=UPI0031BFB2EA|nr:DUF4845 domain-containing protein [Xanthomonadaceae bacterium]
MKSRQTGITLIGFLVVLAVAGVFAYTAMKLVPAYVEFFGVVKSMNQVASEAGATSKSQDELRRDLLYKFSFQYVDTDTVKPQDIKLDQQGNGGTLTVTYDKQIPFAYNVDFLVHFTKSVALQGGGD